MDEHKGLMALWKTIFKLNSNHVGVQKKTKSTSKSLRKNNSDGNLPELEERRVSDMLLLGLEKSPAPPMSAKMASSNLSDSIRSCSPKCVLGPSMASSITMQPTSSASTVWPLEDACLLPSRQSSFITVVECQLPTAITAPSSPFAPPCQASIQAQSFDTAILRTLTPVKVKPSEQASNGAIMDSAELLSPALSCPDSLSVAATTDNIVLWQSHGTEVRHGRSSSWASGSAVNPGMYDPYSAASASILAGLRVEMSPSRSPSISPLPSIREPSQALEEMEVDAYVSIPGIRRGNTHGSTKKSETTSESFKSKSSKDLELKGLLKMVHVQVDIRNSCP